MSDGIIIATIETGASNQFRVELLPHTIVIERWALSDGFWCKIGHLPLRNNAARRVADALTAAADLADKIIEDRHEQSTFPGA